MTVLLSMVVGFSLMSAQVLNRDPFEKVDPALDELISPNARLEQLANHFGFLEGPIWVDADGGYLAFADMAVTLQLDTEIDISRGDLISAPDARPLVQRDLDAEVCWFDAQPLDLARPYLIKHGGATVRARFAQLRHRIDVDTLALHEHPAGLAMNEIAGVRMRVQRPLAFDSYRDNRVTGAFIVIDEANNHTVAAGTIS